MTSPLPLPIRATDIRRHILNIDSRFRQNPYADTESGVVSAEETSSADFYYLVNPPIKNVLRIRITSIEFPNNYLFFTDTRHKTSLRILYKDSGGALQQLILTIPNGNYTAGDMVDALNAAIVSALGTTPWLTVDFSEITGQMTFEGTQYFGVDPTYDSYTRPYDYGLGYYLGFSRQLHKATLIGGGKWRTVSDQCANFSGDHYLFLRVNDYTCVRHNTNTTLVTALAKIVLRDPKNYMTFDDYASQHIKEVVFAQPQNLSRLRIQVVDAYGDLVDLCSTNFSFSLEVLEILNSSLYNTALSGMGLHYEI